MTMMQWAAIETADERSVHVMPESELGQRPHVFGANCWCHPDLERTPNALLLILHKLLVQSDGT